MKTNWTIAAAALLVMLGLAGCTEAAWKRTGGYATPYRVTLYSGGQAVGTWESTGKVKSESESDGWYFVDAKTKRLVIVSGTCVLEQLR